MWFDVWAGIHRRHIARGDALAVVLEDDVALSPAWADYVDVTVEAHWSGQRMAHPKVIGFSLSPIRLNEMQKPFVRWDGPKMYSSEAYLCAVPSSWGGAYWSRLAGPFVRFIQFRMKYHYYSAESAASLEKTYDKLRLQPKELDIPGVRSNVWPNSWKKILIEYVYGNGLVMLYPNLQGEQGYATSLCYNGEHTHLGRHTNPRVAPLAKAFLGGIVGSLWQLPVLNLFMEPVALSHLVLAGASFVDALPSKYLDLQRAWRLTSRECLLDTVAPPKLHSSQLVLVYEPQYGLNNQLIAHENAKVLAVTLGRTLLVPPISMPAVCQGCHSAPFSRYFGTEPGIGDWQGWQQIGTPRVTIVSERSPSVGNLTVTLGPPPLPILELYQVTLRTVERFLAACDDDTIYFNGLFSQKLLAPSQQTTHFSSRTARALEHVYSSISPAFARKEHHCLHHRNGDFTKACRVWEVKQPSWYINRTVAGYKCLTTENDVAGYINFTRKSQKGVHTLVISAEPIVIPNVAAGVSSSQQICRLVTQHFGPDEVLCALIDQELCVSASVAVLNRFSTYSMRIAGRRGKKGNVYWWSRRAKQILAGEYFYE